MSAKSDSRRKKYFALGLRNGFEYRLYRLRRVLEPVFRVGETLRARFRRRKYPQIITLGVNCELAFRFFRKWGFVDSSLFSWAQLFCLDRLTDALGNLSSVLSGPARFDEPSHMWECLNSGIYFHGQLKWSSDAPHPCETELQADLDDLRGRVNHLREKFIRYATNELKTLFIYRLAKGDVMSGHLRKSLERLRTALVDRGARNFDILVVCERADRPQIVLPEGFFCRTVRKFNPGHAITDPELGDPVGWNAIFTEFAPAKLLPKKHAFKFE